MLDFKGKLIVFSAPSGSDAAFNKFLGVPVADENDKVFIQNYNSFSNNGNYEIPSLRYKGEWLSTVSYAIGDFGATWIYEPSFMFQIQERTGEQSIDINGKVYRAMEFGQLWGGISYRNSFDGEE